MSLPKISKRAARRRYFAQAGRCFFCDSLMDPEAWGKDNPNGWTRDHLTPLSQGGKNKANVVLAHRRCNGAKGGRAPTRDEVKKYRRIFPVDKRRK